MVRFNGSRIVGIRRDEGAVEGDPRYYWGGPDTGRPNIECLVLLALQRSLLYQKCGVHRIPGGGPGTDYPLQGIQCTVIAPTAPYGTLYYPIAGPYSTTAPPPREPL